MPQWAGSCWYYLRFLDPRTTRAFEQGGVRRVDARRPLRRRLGARGPPPPLRALLAQGPLRPRRRARRRAVPEARAPGVILGENNEKMSKARGNVVNPDDVVKSHGADASGSTRCSWGRSSR